MSGNLLGDDLCHSGDRQLVRREEKDTTPLLDPTGCKRGTKANVHNCRMDAAGEDLKSSIVFLHQNPG